MPSKWRQHGIARLWVRLTILSLGQQFSCSWGLVDQIHDQSRATVLFQKQLCMRGGGDALVSPAHSPLKSFQRSNNDATDRDDEGRNLWSCPVVGEQMLFSPEPSRKSAYHTEWMDGAAGVDEDGDSLMGYPLDAKAEKDEKDRGNEKLDKVHQDVREQGVNNRRNQTTNCPWDAADSVPFRYVCKRVAAAKTMDDAGRITMLSRLISEVWQHAPEDLAPLLCLLRDQILSPTLEGVELLHRSHLCRVVGEAFAKTPEGLRDALAVGHDDLALTAQRLRACQPTLFPPPPLSLAHVLQALLDVAPARGGREGRDMALRLKTAKALLVAAGAEEALVLVKALEGSLRLFGFSKHVLISALARVAAALGPSPPLSARPTAAAACSAPPLRPRTEDGAAATLAASMQGGGEQPPADRKSAVRAGGEQRRELEGALWQAVGVVPSWRKLVPALLAHGAHGVLAALGHATPRAMTMARGAKLRALQRAERLQWSDGLAEAGGGLHAPAPRSCAEEALQLARERQAAAAASGLPGDRLSQMERRCLAPQLAAGGQEKRLVQLRNEVLRRQRRKMEEEGERGSWLLDKQEATAGLSSGPEHAAAEGAAAEEQREGEAAAVFDALSLLGVVNPALDLMRSAPPPAASARDEGTEGGQSGEATQRAACWWGAGKAPREDKSEAAGRKRVVVVGGGFAGVTTARRLRGWGYQVVVLEAQRRSGGRTWTEAWPPPAASGGSADERGGQQGAVVDLGGMVVTGTVGNPLVALARHHGVPLRPLGATCHLYGADGARVDARADEAGEALFNHLLDKTARIAAARERAPTSPPPPSSAAAASRSPPPPSTSSEAPMHRGATAPGALPTARRSLAECFWGALRSVKEALRSRISSQASRPPKGGAIQRAAGVEGVGVDGQDQGGDQGDAGAAAVLRASSRAESLADTGAGKGGRQARDGCGRGGGERARDLFDCGVVMAPVGQRAPAAVLAGGQRAWTEAEVAGAEALLQWHCANLEFALGAPLDDVSAAWWNFDDACAYAGPHWVLPHGFASLLAPLQQEVPLRLNAPVTRVEYAQQHQSSTARAASVWFREGGEEKRVECDAVVVAVPLGVLQASVRSGAEASPAGSGGGAGAGAAAAEGRISFVPELPEAKAKAIEGMGFGLLNKVVLHFASKFWADAEGDTDFFGVVPPLRAAGADEEERGRGRGAGFMFWPQRGEPGEQGGSLLALMAGKAAQDVEEQSDEEVVGAALLALRQVWGARVGRPQSARVTRWQSDPFARGAYSYMPVEGSTPLDVEEVAGPLEERLFFAGEHTSLSHPAQVCGALLSGLRAAGEVHLALRRSAPPS